MDVRATDSDNISGRFSISRYQQGGSQAALPTTMTTGQDGPTTTSVVTWTRTFSPSVVNELRAGYSRVVIGDVFLDPTGLLGPNGNAKFGIAGGQPIAGASAIIMGDGLENIGSGAAIGETVDNKYQLGNNLTIARGRHFLQDGRPGHPVPAEPLLCRQQRRARHFHLQRQVHRLGLRRLPAQRAGLQGPRQRDREVGPPPYARRHLLPGRLEGAARTSP